MKITKEELTTELYTLKTRLIEKNNKYKQEDVEKNKKVCTELISLGILRPYASELIRDIDDDIVEDPSICKNVESYVKHLGDLALSYLGHSLATYRDGDEEDLVGLVDGRMHMSLYNFFMLEVLEQMEDDDVEHLVNESL